MVRRYAKFDGEILRKATNLAWQALAPKVTDIRKARAQDAVARLTPVSRGVTGCCYPDLPSGSYITPPIARSESQSKAAR
jgi:hypothetical protein